MDGQHPGRHPVADPAASTPPTREEIRDAAAALTEVEYGSGATDLKNGLDKALATVAPNRGRQQLVLFLGDGESAFNPVTEDDRVALGDRMDRDDVVFFAVPLGLKVNPHNLHGLAVAHRRDRRPRPGRPRQRQRRAEFVARLDRRPRRAGREGREVRSSAPRSARFTRPSCRRCGPTSRRS